MGNRQTQSGWIKKYLKPLENEAVLSAIDQPGLGCLESNPWAILKMAALWSYAHHIYLPIIKKHYTNAIYVDLFSGPGLTIDKTSDRRLVGTASLMASIASTRGGFSNCVFVERDRTYSAALEIRLESLKKAGLLTCGSWSVIQGDCNEVVDSMIQQLQELHSHVLLFVDPFGFNFRFDTLKALISAGPAFDMFMNLQVGPIARSTGREARGDFTEEALRAFFPDGRWRGCIESRDMRECLKERYIECLYEYGGERIQTVKPIRVRGSGDYYYYLLFTTRKSESGWIQGVDRIKEMVESYDCMSIQHYLCGGKTIEDFQTRL